MTWICCFYRHAPGGRNLKVRSGDGEIWPRHDVACPNLVEFINIAKVVTLAIA